MIRIAIVEDEADFAHQMEDYVARYQRERGESIRVTVYTDGTELVEQYNGDMDISTDNGWFRLKLLIPMPEEGKIG